MRFARLARVVVPAVLVLPSLAAAQSPPPGFSYETVWLGRAADRYCSMAFAPDGRLFLAERVTGAIRYLQNGAISGVWATVPKTGGAMTEQGLLGIAVDPNFLANRYVYVFYTRSVPTLKNVVARLEEVGGVGMNLTVISPEIGASVTGIHNGGRLVFGLDGKLYAGTGDRANTSTPQDQMSLNGKILRMNAPDGSAPADNPFAVDPTFHPLVWSYGHRNQYGLTVHPATGDLFQTENGESMTDEVNRIVKAGNYGWPMYEGPEPVPDPATEDPLASYSPTPDPTGTAIYTGLNYPVSYRNTWFFIRYTANKVQHLVLDPFFTSVVSQSQFDDLLGNGYDVLNGPDGNLWYLTHDTAGVRGGNEVGRYVHSGEPIPSENVTPVSNQILGGSVTLGFHGTNGDLVVHWLSLTKFAAPVPTVYGDWWVPVDLVLPSLTIAGDNRAYMGFSVPNNPAFAGLVVYFQGGHVPLAGPIRLTNPAEITLK